MEGNEFPNREKMVEETLSHWKESVRFITDEELFNHFFDRIKARSQRKEFEVEIKFRSLAFALNTWELKGIYTLESASYAFGGYDDNKERVFTREQLDKVLNYLKKNGYSVKSDISDSWFYKNFASSHSLKDVNIKW